MISLTLIIQSQHIEGFMIKNKNLIVVSLLICFTLAVIKQDLMLKIPGYDDKFKGNIYSGYLNLTDTSRKLHYLFVQSINGPTNTDPLILWLNGGPGCSSLLGFIQEIGPYFMEEGKNYTVGDQLIENPYSWYKISNLLFLESPAGVGYSINSNQSFIYNDATTLLDNFQAILFFFTHYSEYKNRPFWIAGQSYAGKYIPDLGQKIDQYNKDPNTPSQKKIKLVGLFIGNGVIDFRDESIFKSQIQYFINHDFVDPETLSYWQNSCAHDEQSAGCQFFYSRYQQTLDDVNPYNIYSYCFYNDSFASDNPQKPKMQFLSQQSILLSLSKSIKTIQKGQTNLDQPPKSRFNGAPCAYFDGMYQYFNAHYQQYHAQDRISKNAKWNGPCAEDIGKKYTITPYGSVYQMTYLIQRTNDIRLILYNGDWDGVVPFSDTIKNLQNLKIAYPSTVTPIFFNRQHIGFNMTMKNVTFITMKGASHQVPQSKRAESLFIVNKLFEKNTEIIVSQS